ncbi:MAG TPA: M1 family metallopeptidase [Terriglobia bacterium]|nr:M1 family metallopeptidase [Terriglobia bacterium]
MSRLPDAIARYRLVIFALFLFLPPPWRVTTSAQTAAPAASALKEAPVPGMPLSVHVVAYQIDARLDPARKSIAATETLTYHNLTGQPLAVFPFHLYLNAFQPKSTFMTEVRLGGTRGTGPQSGWDPKHYGAIEVKSLEVVGVGDLTRQMEFIQPDDGHKDDHTVFQVRLPKPVPPGDDVQFRIAFHEQLPEVLERTGYKRDFFMVGQWFPKVGVWWHGAWNCHQFHSTSEFFADFGTFDVKTTVPANYILGSTGDPVASLNNPDGTKTVTWHAEDIHDFSWTASPNFHLVEDSWTGSAGTVKIHLLMSPGHLRQTRRYLHSLKGTLDRFDRWYGPYPYDRITVVDPPHGALEAGGMEYPTLITGGSAWWEPRGLRETEIVTEHEFGHQYWYGMVATNEFEEAWMDEGINSYAEAKILDSLYGQGQSAVNLLGMTADDSGILRMEYLDEPDTDPMARFAYKYMNTSAYGGITYGKTATVLLTLEGLIGEDTMRRAMHTYFMRYRFTHPTGEDFLKTIEEVSGQNLRWYYDQAVYGTNILDYEVLNIRSDRIDWHEKKPPPAKEGQTLYRDTVLVHRKGDFIFPVEVEVKFSNGERLREHWDGRDRWIRYTYEKKARVISAEIDPDHKVLLDRDFFNDSKTEKPDSRATRKLSTYWLFVTQGMAQLLAWFA